MRTKNDFITYQKADEFLVGDKVILSSHLPSLSTQTIPFSMARLLGFVLSDGSMNRRKRRAKDGRGNWYNLDKQRLLYFSIDYELLHLVQQDIKMLFSQYTPALVKDKNRCPAVQVIS